MECPFELPAEKIITEKSYPLEKPIRWGIVDKEGRVILYESKCEKTIDYIVQAINSHEKLEEALAWLLKEYHFFSRKMTEINNIVQPLWGETRERRADYQLIEDFIEQIKEKGLEQALETEKK